MESAEIRRFLEALVRESGVSGISVAKLSREACIAVTAGQVHNGSSRKLGPRSAFDVGCAGNLFIALLVLRLVDEGLISVEDSVLDYLPDLPLCADIRIKHLLSHTSGFRSPELIHPEMVQRMTWDQFIGALGDSDQLFSPGSVFSYSRVEYVVLGEVIRRIVGIHPVSMFIEWVLKHLRARRRSRWTLSLAELFTSDGSMFGVMRSKLQNPGAELHPFWSLAGSGFTISMSELAMIMNAALEIDTRGRSAAKLPALSSLRIMREPAILVPRFLDNTGGLEELPEAFACGSAMFSDGSVGHSGTSRRHCVTVRHLDSGDTVAVAASNPMPHVRDIALKRLLSSMPALSSQSPTSAGRRAAKFRADELAGVYVGGAPQHVTLRSSANKLTCQFGSAPPFATFEIGPDGDVRLLGRRLLLPVAFFREEIEGTPCVNLGLHAFKRIGEAN